MRYKKRKRVRWAMINIQVSKKQTLKQEEIPLMIKLSEFGEDVNWCPGDPRPPVLRFLFYCGDKCYMSAASTRTTIN